VAINELNENVENIAYNINYDSTYGKIAERFTSNGRYISNGKYDIKIYNCKKLEDISLDDVDIIIDASGSKVDTKSLKSLPVKAIFLTHPNKNADINVILGVNSHEISQKYKIISTSSCNATALLPVIKIIDENLHISCGEIATIHPLLNHQKLLDGSCIGSQNRQIDCNFEFGRSAFQNIIPSKTTTIEACSYVLPHINADLISASSFRVPTSTVGVIDATFFVKQKTSKNTLIELFKKYEKSQDQNILLYNQEKLVSSDFKAQDFTTIIESRFVDVKCDHMIKLAIWYDNEWGYANRVLDIVSAFAKLNQ
jgi:glyceraldehyde 3-phosphate dehydrogenase